MKNYFFPTDWEQPMIKDSAATVIWRHRTLQEYVKAFTAGGLSIVDLNEPVPTEEQATQGVVGIAWLRKIPIFLFWELQKQAS